jgi:hypothetical protein
LWKRYSTVQQCADMRDNDRDKEVD